MLQYKDGRFSAQGVSFSIPNGFFLETEPEFCYEYGFGAWTPDKQYYMEWQIETGCTGTENELRQLFETGSETKPLSEIQPVTVNGLAGHYTAYQNKNGQFFELRLSAHGGTEIALTVKSAGGDILAAMHTPSIKAAMDGIRPE